MLTVLVLPFICCYCFCPLCASLHLSHLILSPVALPSIYILLSFTKPTSLLPALWPSLFALEIPHPAFTITMFTLDPVPLAPLPSSTKLPDSSLCCSSCFLFFFLSQGVELNSEVTYLNCSHLCNFIQKLKSPHCNITIN